MLSKCYDTTGKELKMTRRWPWHILLGIALRTHAERCLSVRWLLIHGFAYVCKCDSLQEQSSASGGQSPVLRALAAGGHY